MTQVIHKYPLRWEHGVQEVEMPATAVVRKVHTQYRHRDLMLWAQHTVPAAEMHKRRFHLVWTGEEFDISGRYIGTVCSEFNGFIWHVFEETK